MYHSGFEDIYNASTNSYDVRSAENRRGGKTNIPQRLEDIYDASISKYDARSAESAAKAKTHTPQRFRGLLNKVNLTDGEKTKAAGLRQGCDIVAG